MLPLENWQRWCLLLFWGCLPILMLMKAKPLLLEESLSRWVSMGEGSTSQPHNLQPACHWSGSRAGLDSMESPRIAGTQLLSGSNSREEREQSQQKQEEQRGRTG